MLAGDEGVSTAGLGEAAVDTPPDSSGAGLSGVFPPAAAFAAAIKAWGSSACARATCLTPPRSA